MSQSRLGSLQESLVNIVTGIGLNYCANLILIPLVLHTARVPLLANAELTAFFTGISLVRSYGLRRLFNYLHRNHRTHDCRCR
jgi:hypothetical protein